MAVTVVDLSRRLNYLERLIQYSLTTGGGGGGSSNWGTITGTLSNQTDLKTALDGKSSISHSHNIVDLSAATLPSGSIVFSNGTNLTQHSTKLFFDDLNERVGLLTDAPTHTLTVGNGGTGVGLYSTTDQITNYQRIVLSSNSVNAWTLDTQKGGVGTLVGGFYIASAGTVQMGWDGTQIVAYKNILPISNNTLDIGRHTSGLKFRSLFLGTSLSVDLTGAPTAKIHLGAGTAAAGTAPFKLTTGVALTTPEDGAMEYHNSHLYFTIGSTRYQLDQQGGSTSWGSISGTLSSQSDLQTALDTKLGVDKSDAVLKGFQLLGSNIKAWSLGSGPARSATSTAIVDGTIRWAAIYIHETVTLTGAGFFQKVQGDYVADNFNGMGLYSYSSTGGGTLTQVAVTANNGNLFKATANSWVKEPFTSTYVASPGLYYICYIWNASATTTAPSILHDSNLTSANIVLEAKLWGQNTNETVLPASQLLSAIGINAGVAFLFVY